MAILRPLDPRDRYQRPYGAPRTTSALDLAFDAAPRRRKAREIVLRPVHPNAGTTAEFRRRLIRVIDEMAASFQHWLEAAYRKNEPAVRLAMDEVPAAVLQAAVDQLARRWRKRFDDMGPELAAWFAKAARARSDRQLMAILKKGGMTVDFKMTAAMRDVAKATVEQSVQLIRSIPEQYLTDVQGAVMRSVQAGRDLGSLAKELREKHGVTKRRAATIALDQNNKATSAMTRVRQQEIGVERAIWQHSMGGKEPRHTHVKNSGKSYDVKKGWYDPDPKVRRRIWPGELIHCRCVSRGIVKGFD